MVNNQKTTEILSHFRTTLIPPPWTIVIGKDQQEPVSTSVIDWHNVFITSTNLYPAGNPQRRAVVQNQTGGLMSNIFEEIKDQQRVGKQKTGGK
jgi:hypothetical protein